MRIYKIKVSLSYEQIDIDPFFWLRRLKDKVQLAITKYRIKSHYKRLKWDKDFVCTKTMFCASLPDACYRLVWELIQSYEGKRFLSDCKYDGNRMIETFCYRLIMKDFETGKF